GTDFYHYADGNWVKNNPVPADKSRWGGFAELQERNWFLVHGILNETIAGDAPANSPKHKVADYFRSAMNTNRLEELAFKPLHQDLERIDQLRNAEDVLRLLADFHARGIGACFGRSAAADAKNSAVYALYINQ